MSFPFRCECGYHFQVYHFGIPVLALLRLQPSYNCNIDGKESEPAGTGKESQAELDARLPHLLSSPLSHLYLSF